MKKLLFIFIFLSSYFVLVGQAYSAELYKAASAGDADAQLDLAICYYEGNGIAQNYGQAAYWAEKAADQGNAWAQYDMGYFYEYGKGVEANPYKAYGWYKKAAEKGVAEAEYALACCYFNGDGVEPNDEEFFRWLKKAAIDGVSTAQVWLGMDYAYGRHTTKDDTLALYWIRKAAEQDNPSGLYWLGKCYQRGTGITPDLDLADTYFERAAIAGHSDAQVEMAMKEYSQENYREAVKWLEIAVAYGNSNAELLLGTCYETGTGVTEDFYKAKEYYERAALHGDIKGFQYIGNMYGEENSPHRSLPEAYNWYLKAASLDDPISQRIVAYMLLTGEGVKEDPTQGLLWLERACDNGEYLAICMAGIIYFEGSENFPKDYTKAFKYLSKAAEAEDLSESPYKDTIIDYLAQCYQCGYGTKKDYQKATELRSIHRPVVKHKNNTTPKSVETDSRNQTNKEMPSWDEKIKKFNL